MDRDSEEYRRAAEEFGRALGRFHLSARGFQSWPSDREADFWIWNFRRVQAQVKLARSQLMNEERPEIRQLVESALENCEPYLGDVVQRAEQNVELFRSVLRESRQREDVRHCDLHSGNFLIGADGLIIIDLAELHPGPRILEAPGLWDGDQAQELAVQLTKAEVELFPVINDSIDGWRRFFDGYLSGDWTDEMLTNYYWHVHGYEVKQERLALTADTLREVVGMI